MRKKVLFTLAFLCFGFTFSQTFNYQSVVRNAAGDPIPNQSMGVLIRIIEGSPAGSVLYNETHTVLSNAHGIITLPVGGGTSNANFLAIDWSLQNQWINIQVDIAGGTSYTDIGTSKLQFVPYALYAMNSSTSTDAGPFDYTNNVVSNANGNIITDDFVFGSTQLDVNGAFSPSLNNRMFFDKSKAAFRAGYTSDDQWDEPKVGNHSVGLGEGGTASGSNSFSMGRNANATGDYSIAFGLNAGGFADYARGFGLTARAYGQHATAMGRQVIANSMSEVQLGQYSTFVSGSADTWEPTDRLFVIGNGQEDINLALNSDALVMLKNGNTTLNGTFTIDGDNQGAGTSYTLPAQDGTVNQIMQTDGSGNVVWATPAAAAIPNGGNNGEVLATDGSGNLLWVNNDILPVGGTDGFVLKTDGSGNYAWVTNNDADNDAANEIELPVGGNNGQVLATDGSGVYSWIDQPSIPGAVFSTISNVTSNAPGTIVTDDFVFGSTQLNNITGADDNSRMFFDKSLGAFRAGNEVDGFGGFDEANLGPFSVGFGQRNVASGWYSSTLGGQRNTSSGYYSMTMGDNNTASASYTVALGKDNNASGLESIALGYSNTAESRGQISLGYLSTIATGDATAYVPTDRLLVVGNGTSDINGVTRSDALVILKNGNTTLNGELTIDGDNAGTGAAYTLPAQDGSANQIMSTNGSGVVSWIAAPSGGGATLPAGGTDGDVLKTDGSGNYAWVNNDVLPSGGANGQILSTDGSGGYTWIDEVTGTSTFSTTSNVTSNANGSIATDDFVFGSMQLANDTNTTDDDNRMYFDKSKGAFRVGRAFSDEWDDSNTALYTIAMGNNNLAKGIYSVAIGDRNSANFDTSIALGDWNVLNNANTYALGSHLLTETPLQTSLGVYNTSYTSIAPSSFTEPTNRILVIGNGTSTTRSDALVMLRNGNTTLNGSLTIDGDNAGAGTAYTFPAQDGTANQVMTTDGSGNVSWVNAAAGGVFTTTANVTSNANGTIATDDFVFGSTQLNNDANTVDDDKRFFFDKSRGAFRAGEVEADEWDTTNIGTNSTSFGINNISSGAAAFTAGDENQATRFATVAMGVANRATGSTSVAIGTNAKAESRGQISLGVNNTAVAGDAYAHVATDRLFVIGNGITTAASDALVMLKNGNTTLNGQLTIDGDNQGAGASYTLPAQDGTANQVMTTDGFGNVSWVSVPSDGDSDPTNEIELPTQTGQAGKFLTTDGTNPSWTNTIEATSVKIPSLPAFNVTSNGTVYTSAGEKEVGDWNATVNGDLFNDGNHLNLTNGRFTAPVDGLYFFSAQVRLDGMNGVAYSRLMIVKNGNKQSFRNGLHSIRNADTGTASWDTQHISGILKLNAGDYVSVFVESSGDTNWTLQSESGFNGYLVNKL